MPASCESRKCLGRSRLQAPPEWLTQSVKALSPGQESVVPGELELG